MFDTAHNTAITELICNDMKSQFKCLVKTPVQVQAWQSRLDPGVQDSPCTKKEDDNLQDPNVQSKAEVITSKSGSDEESQPNTTKCKLSGVKKSNKERRRRQNENLRRLLSPKNALMVLNEMLPKEQLTNLFRVKEIPSPCNNPCVKFFCADLTLDGSVYKGFGDNKIIARNAAAEHAIRDIFIKKMDKQPNAEASVAAGAGEEEEPLPMIQLASFALHKLFNEWETAGYKVPQLRPSATTTELELCGESAEGSGPARPSKKQKTLPQDAALMHPCILLAYMRPMTQYRELDVQGDCPQNKVYTMVVEIDGITYKGKASNKKQARREAAVAVCEELYGVKFENL